jgi:hypothetical protein
MDPTYAARSAPPPASGAWCVRLDRHIADDSPLALLPFATSLGLDFSAAGLTGLVNESWGITNFEVQGR